MEVSGWLDPLGRPPSVANTGVPSTSTHVRTLRSGEEFSPSPELEIATSGAQLLVAPALIEPHEGGCLEVPPAEFGTRSAEFLEKDPGLRVWVAEMEMTQVAWQVVTHGSFGGC